MGPRCRLPKPARATLVPRPGHPWSMDRSPRGLIVLCMQTQLEARYEPRSLSSLQGCRLAATGRWGLLLAALFSSLLLPEGHAQDGRRGQLRRNTLVEDGEALGVGRLVPDLRIEPLRGELTSLGALLEGQKALVVAVTSASCPVSKKYAPRLAALERAYAERGVAFVYLNAVGNETEAEIVEQIRDHGFQGPYLPDREGELVRALGVRTTAEVYLLDAARTLVYRGAVDDQYGVGTTMPAPRRHFLRDALERLLDGQRQRIRATWAPGCLVDHEEEPQLLQDPDLTYAGRISRILADKCVTCHRLGGDAPFSFQTSADLRGRLSMVEAVVADGLMPPWHEAAASGGEADPEGPSWANHRALTARERADLLAWLRGGTPMGGPTPPPVLPPLPQSWWIGRPDLVLSTPALELPEEGPMQHARMVVASGLEQDRWVESIELRPLKNDTVHHGLVWILPPGEGLPRLDEQPEGLELLGIYGPGDGRIQLLGDTARRLEAGSLFVVDMYAIPMGKIMHARMRIGLRFREAAPEWQLRSRLLSVESLELAADEPEVVSEASLVLEEITRLGAIWPYMRARGEWLELRAHLPGGEVLELLDARSYDYRWQIRYELIEPLLLPAGTRLELRGSHDNSPDNPNNPGGGRAAAAGPGVEDDALFVGLELLERPAPAGR